MKSHKNPPKKPPKKTPPPQPLGMTLATDLKVLNRPLYQVSPKTITQYLRDWLAVKVSYIQVDSNNHVIQPNYPLEAQIEGHQV